MPLKPKPMPRGGARVGAGRKAPDGAVGLKPRRLMLNDEQYDVAIRLGDGNASAGVRKALSNA